MMAVPFHGVRAETQRLNFIHIHVRTQVPAYPLKSSAHNHQENLGSNQKNHFLLRTPWHFTPCNNIPASRTRTSIKVFFSTTSNSTSGARDAMAIALSNGRDLPMPEEKKLRTWANTYQHALKSHWSLISDKMLKDYIEAISESLGHECSVLYSSHPLSCTFPSLPIAAMPEKHIPNSKSHTNLQVLYIYIRLYKYIVIVYHNPKLDQVNYILITYTNLSDPPMARCVESAAVHGSPAAWQHRDAKPPYPMRT